MTATITANVAPCNLKGKLLQGDAEAMLLGSDDPVFGIGGLRRAELDAFFQARQRRGHRADDLRHCVTFDFDIVVGGDFLCQSQIETGLRFVCVGNGCGTDFKVTFGRGKLLGNGGFLCADKN